MKIKTSELVGDALDWAVAQCEGWTDTRCDASCNCLQHRNPEGKASILPHYSTHWGIGGPIIDREGLDLYCNVPTNPEHESPLWRGAWRAKYHRCGFGTEMSYGPTALIAAMRCFVALKLGGEIEVPKELLL